MNTKRNITPALVGAWPKFVRSCDGKRKGVVTSTTRRCSLEGCNGRRIGVRWPNGQLTYPCSKRLSAVPDEPDTWIVL